MERSNNPSFEQPKLTKVASDSSKLKKFRNWDSTMRKACEYDGSQRGETSRSLNGTTFNRDFAKDGQNIGKIGQSVHDNFNMDLNQRQQERNVVKLAEALRKNNDLQIDLIKSIQENLGMKHKNIDLEEENRHQNQENQALEQLIRYRELEDILQKAKPELSRESILVLEMIEKYLKNMEDKPSDDKYKNAIEEALGILSPETLADYKKYGIEFVLNEGMSYPTARRNKKEGKWEMNLPTKYEYPIQSMILRCIDDILKVDFEGVKKKAKESESQAMIATEEMLARRIEITARVFQANMMLGKNYGWDIKGYELAERYHKDYQDGIREAFAKGLVNQDTLKDDLIERGQTYAKKKLLDSIKPRDDVPAIFPSMQSGAYFEEFTIKERIIGHKNPPVKFRAEEPIMFGTSECDKPIDDLGVSREKEEDSVLNAAIMPDKTIWVLP